MHPLQQTPLPPLHRRPVALEQHFVRDVLLNDVHAPIRLRKLELGPLRAGSASGYEEGPGLEEG